MAAHPQTQESSSTARGPLRSPFRLLASLKVAVVLLSVVAVVCIATTIVESRLGGDVGTPVVQWYVYDHPWFAGLLALLALNILAAMLIRFPWKMRQMGFVVTHVGVLMLLAGSLQTYWRGIEGQLSIDEGDEADTIVINGRSRLTVFRQGEDGQESTEFSFYGGPRDWGDDRVLDFGEIDGAAVEVLRFYPHARREEQWIADDSDIAPPAAKVAIIGPDGQKVAERWLRPDQFGLQGKAGDEIEITDGRKLLVLKSLPHARPQVTFRPADRDEVGSSRLEAAALFRVTVDGTTREFWLERNSPQFGIESIPTGEESADEESVHVAFGYEQLALGFSLKLHDFVRGLNPGRMGNASYSSEVQLIDKDEGIDRRRKIWMNHPLTHRKFSFYQSEYRELGRGKERSILSVAHDPGRLLKYTGSTILCVGMFIMFYIRPSFTGRWGRRSPKTETTAPGGLSS